jgi:hypothetical protein
MGRNIWQGDGAKHLAGRWGENSLKSLALFLTD